MVDRESQTVNTERAAGRYDAVVVGARVAGAATALLLGRSGLRVLLLDRGEYAGDTLSTLALMRGGVLQLHRWGLLPRVIEAGTPPVKETTFHYGDKTLRVAIKSKHDVDYLLAPRRTVLDRILVDAAVEAGVLVRHGWRIVDLLRSTDDRVDGVVAVDRSGSEHRVRADLVIGADGIRSVVARLVGAETYRHGRHATGVMYGFWSGLPVDGYHWHYGSGVAAGRIPTNGGLTLVFTSLPASRFHAVYGRGTAVGFVEVLRAAAPDMASFIASSTDHPRLTGFSGQVGYFRQSYGPGWALVGDAGYFKDPITAHGITDALRDAELVASAVVRRGSGALEDYQRRRDELSEQVFTVTEEIASFTWDLETIGPMLESLARAMSAEVKAMYESSRGRQGVTPGLTLENRLS